MGAEGSRQVWHLGERSLDLGERSLFVGILNVTPDSFSDGGRFEAVETAVDRAVAMVEEGAAMVDVGGESTRPGFEPVSADEETRRVAPVIEELTRRAPEVLISIDTSKAEVAREALSAGAKALNDIWGFQGDPDMAAVAAEFSAGVILMRNGRDGSRGGSVLDRIRRSWEKSLTIAENAGVGERRIVLDPGIGFGTTRQEDLEIMRGLDVLRAFGFPLLLGTSLKRFTAEPLGYPLEQRLETTLATTVAGIAAGVDLFRVHHVAENARAASLADLIYRGGAIDG